MHEQLQAEYSRRFPALDALRAALEAEVRDALEGLPHIDRIGFRVKGLASFLKKATDPANAPPYKDPLVEIEDQVAGRVIVFFLGDLEKVAEKIETTFTTVEHSRRKPERDAEFGYESEHRVCLIPPHLRPADWPAQEMPTTFELQVRTIFMHAYAEPQHDFAYKSKEHLKPPMVRELAWIAASAWGADQAYERLRQLMSEAPDVNASDR
jgi:putative GTP pyrophosphokinase